MSTILFTGYRWEDVERMPEAAALRDCIDVLLAGRYEQERHLGAGLRGSSNKTVHCFTGRYSPEGLDAVPHSEVIIRGGEVVVTGIDPPAFVSEDPNGRRSR